MIKLVSIALAGGQELELTFSDGSSGHWSAAQVLAKETVLTRPLLDENYFRRAFIEGGALAWPNGLEFSAASLHRRLNEAGLLTLCAA